MDTELIGFGMKGKALTAFTEPVQITRGKGYTNFT